MYQTYQREIITLQCTINARIEVKYCPNHNELITFKPDILDEIVAKGRTYGIDVVIAIGLLRWGLCLQREQIQQYLKRKDINISTGTISNLSFDFLLLLKQIHEKQYTRLKKNFIKLGGMITHFDATDENGGNAVFQIKEGITGITLMAESIVSEKEEYMTPILQTFKGIFGNPIAIVRDMGSALIKSCNKVFSSIPQQICHFHFIRALGKNIFDDIYGEFRFKIIATKIIADLKYIRKGIKQKLRESSVVLNEKHALYWAHLLVDYILYPIKSLKDYPFELSYMEFYLRITEISDLFSDDCLKNGGSCLKVQPLSFIKSHIENFMRKKTIQKLFKNIEQLWKWFLRIRKTMGVMRNQLKEKRNLSHHEIKTMKEKLKRVIYQVNYMGKKLGGLFQRKAKMISDHIKLRWNNLFVEVRDKKGKYLPIPRDNNVDEQAHRWIRMGIRRRTGKQKTQNEMFQLGSLLALFSNLYNERYQGIICAKIDNIAQEFSRLDWKRLPLEKKELFLRNDGISIPISDKIRKKMLYDFVKKVKRTSLGYYSNLDKWLEKMDGHIESWKFDFIEVDSELGVL